MNILSLMSRFCHSELFEFVGWSCQRCFAYRPSLILRQALEWTCAKILAHPLQGSRRSPCAARSADLAMRVTAGLEQGLRTSAAR